MEDYVDEVYHVAKHVYFFMAYVWWDDSVLFVREPGLV